MRAHGTGMADADPDLTISYSGTDIPASAGDSVASALTAAGIRACRETDAGDPRGLFCGMGVCAECSVVVDGRDGALACLTPVQDGMTIERQPARTVLRPADDGAGNADLPEIVLRPDVLIVGGGPAGLTAAAVAAESGVDVLLVDERAKPGGQYYKQPAAGTRIDPDRLDGQYREGRALIARFAASGAKSLSGAKVWAAFAPDHVVAASPDTRWVIHPRQLVLATGAYERGIPVPGWTLPGVMTTGAAQTLLRSHQVAPGRRVLIAGNGPLNLQLAAELTRAGVTVVAVAELGSPFTPGRLRSVGAMSLAAPALAGLGAGYLVTLLRRRVPVVQSSAVVRCSGDTAVRSVTVARIDRAGDPVAGSSRTFEVDAVCLGYGFLPSNELARALGCEHRADLPGGALRVVRDPAGRTTVPGVWVIGAGGESLGAKVAAAAGALCGAALSHRAGATAVGSPDVSRIRRALDRHLRFQRNLATAYSAPILSVSLADPGTVVCRCEGVTLADLTTDLTSGVGAAGALKRVTRVGMGKCQGRYCGPAVVGLAQAVTGAAPDAYSGFRPQAPVRPTPVGTIAAPPDH